MKTNEKKWLEEQKQKFMKVVLLLTEYKESELQEMNHLQLRKIIYEKTGVQTSVSNM